MYNVILVITIMNINIRKCLKNVAEDTQLFIVIISLLVGA